MPRSTMKAFVIKTAESRRQRYSNPDFCCMDRCKVCGSSNARAEHERRPERCLGCGSELPWHTLVKAREAESKS